MLPYAPLRVAEAVLISRVTRVCLVEVHGVKGVTCHGHNAFTHPPVFLKGAAPLICAAQCPPLPVLDSHTDSLLFFVFLPLLDSHFLLTLVLLITIIFYHLNDLLTPLLFQFILIVTLFRFIDHLPYLYPPPSNPLVPF
ncbi:hypothetical protein E2C01_047288 [Portunus trituberculatus]|uniref:Uncharacterized protein n=1 Tax=Portunus trituberculatus TaxID=210409 RepID=A0A5B7G725_PORTR|nr:hypothetical protein [Portunus trituberculatus]